MKLAITITHNKTDAENEAQITALLPLVTKITDLNPEFDEQGNQIGSFETYHYELKGLNIPHEVRFYQVVPFGVTPPPSLYKLDSHKVFYGKGDEDKTGDHPRFFNWGLKRGTDNGADISLYLEDASKFDPAKIMAMLEKLANKADPTEFAENVSGKLATLRLLKEVGQLKEDRAMSEAITELKTRVAQGGMRNG